MRGPQPVKVGRNACADSRSVPRTAERFGSERSVFGIIAMMGFCLRCGVCLTYGAAPYLFRFDRCGSERNNGPHARVLQTCRYSRKPRRNAV